LKPAEKNDAIGGLDELLDLLDAHRRG
jgi:hypothetical protein